MDKNERKSMIKVRGGFSERNKIIQFSDAIQSTEFDNCSRIALCNCIYDFLYSTFAIQYSSSAALFPEYPSSYEISFCKNMIRNVFHEHDEHHYSDSYSWKVIYSSVKEVITTAPYNEVLDIIEYVCNLVEYRSGTKNTVYQNFNNIFEQEHIGYRFVSKQIVPITDESEAQEIGQACQTPFDGARAQLQKALGFLSDRENPDYKNCVKESISAVESVCKVISGNEKATLKDALNGLIANGMNIHGSLKSAILALYGYASDEGGIRHAERETESTVTFEEAKFMMVTCSAIVNYLVAEYGKHGAGNA